MPRGIIAPCSYEPRARRALRLKTRSNAYKMHYAHCCPRSNAANPPRFSRPPPEWPFVLSTMTRNAARNRRRRADRARPHLDVVDVPLLASDVSADVALAKAETHVRLRACIAELCEVQRAVVMLRLLDEQPGEDVALTLGISRGYVDVLAHRAKASLRTCMTREA